jgi:hypothetical protein
MLSRSLRSPLQLVCNGKGTTLEEGDFRYMSILADTSKWMRILAD